MKNIISINSLLLKMFIESVQYSLQSVKVVIKNYTDNQKMLPVSMSDNVKCLDFDLDKVVFRHAPSSPIKLAEVNPYNKSLLEVMEMV